MAAKRIYFNTGKHRIEDVDMTVTDVMALLSAGMSVAQVEDHFFELTEDDIKACISYAIKHIE